jgi:hypothetical protein
VKEYPAFGEEVTNDCSVRFSSLLKEQEGYWICGVRGPGITSFINSPPAKLVVHRTSKVIIIFVSEWIIEVQLYRGVDKSLAQPGRKQARVTEDFDVHISYL